MKYRTVKSTKNIKRGESAWVKDRNGRTSSLYTKDDEGRCYHKGVTKNNDTGRTHPIYTD